MRNYFRSAISVLVFLGCLTLAMDWLGAQRLLAHVPRDYEECSELAGFTPSSKERASMLGQCNARFAGRRKVDGGYSYYDFMQNRHFDIAGPTPSPDELKEIDKEYLIYLDAQRRSAIAAAEKQKTLLQADLESASQPPEPRKTVGPPLMITPTNVPTTGTGATRSKAR